MKTDPNDQSFPLKFDSVHRPGLTKREYFAAQALVTLAADRAFTTSNLIKRSVELADALIEELNKNET